MLVKAESSLGVTIKRYDVLGTIECRDLPRPYSPDLFERRMLQAIAIMRRLHRQTWGRDPEKLILGRWMRRRLRRLHGEPRPVREYRMPERTPLGALLSTMGPDAPARTLTPREVERRRPTIDGLYIVEAERYGGDRYHIDLD